MVNQVPGATPPASQGVSGQESVKENSSRPLSRREENTDSVGKRVLDGLGEAFQKVKGFFTSPFTKVDVKKTQEDFVNLFGDSSIFSGADSDVKVKRDNTNDTQPGTNGQINIPTAKAEEQDSVLVKDKTEDGAPVAEAPDDQPLPEENEHDQQKEMRYLGSIITADNIGKALLIGGGVTLSLGLLAAVSVATMGGGLPVIALAAILICAGSVMLGYGGVASSQSNPSSQPNTPEANAATPSSPRTLPPELEKMLKSRQESRQEEVKARQEVGVGGSAAQQAASSDSRPPPAAPDDDLRRKEEEEKKQEALKKRREEEVPPTPNKKITNDQEDRVKNESKEVQDSPLKGDGSETDLENF